MNRTRMLSLCALVFTTVCAAWLFRTNDVAAVPPAPEPTAPVAPAVPASAPASAPATADTPAEPVQDPNTATIIVATVPAATATVTWGRKLLGRIKPGKPLVVQRPRDSGPLDIVVRAVGYLAVQTRAHTFSDNRVIVKLTRPENAIELLGYRAPMPEDGGVLSPEEAAAQSAMAPPIPGAPPVLAPAQSVPAPAPVGPPPVPPAPTPAQ